MNIMDCMVTKCVFFLECERQEDGTRGIGHAGIEIDCYGQKVYVDLENEQKYAADQLDQEHEPEFDIYSLPELYERQLATA